jgi:DNA-binding IclR family transcriptional regulator
MAMTQTEPKRGKPSIQVIERMMHLLDALSRQTTPASLKLLAGETGLHPSTAHRILGVMVESRLVERLEPGLYRLGIRLVQLGSLVKSRLSVRQEALPHMQALHQALGETVNLSLRRGDEVVYIERASGANTMMRVVQIIGARAPLHITAVGKIFLAAATPAEVDAYIARSGLPRYTDRTLGDAGSLERELALIRARGYACDHEEAERGVCCVGAGIYNDEHQLAAGLSVSAPAERFSADWAEPVRRTAGLISRALGHEPDDHNQGQRAGCSAHDRTAPMPPFEPAP